MIILSKRILACLLSVCFLFIAGCSSSDQENVDEALKHLAKDLNLSGLFETHVKTGTTITFDATRANCPVGSLATYVWTLDSKPAGSSESLSDTSNQIVTLTLDEEGDYSASVIIACGSKTISETFTATASDTPTNAKAIAISGVAQSVKVGRVAQLDGGKSFDTDGNALTYSWSIISTPSGSTASLSADNVAQPNFTPDVMGTYEFSLIVHDGTIDSAPSTTFIYATDPTVNAQPTANAGHDQTDVVGHEVSLHGFGSHDADGDALTYEWNINSMPSTSNMGQILSGSQPGFDNTATEPKFTPDVTGHYVFRLRVNDGSLTSTWDYVTISVNTSQHSSSPLNDLIAMGLDSTDAHYLLANHAADAAAVSAISDRIFSSVQITDDMFTAPTDPGAAGFSDTQMTTWEARHIKRFKKIFGRIAFVVNTTKFKDAFDAQVGLLDASYQGSNNMTLPASLVAFKSDLLATITHPASFADYKSAINSVVEDVFSNSGKFKFYISNRASGTAYGGRVLKLKVERYGMVGDASLDGNTKPWKINQAAALIFHELMHSVGYAHDPSNDQTTLKPNNIPYFVQIIAGYQATDILNAYCGGAVANCSKTLAWGYPSAVYTHFFGDT